jgi:hypothetical protein
MNTMRKGLIVTLVQILLVTSLGAKLLYDRATQPRAWTRTAAFDPNLPIRGRYVSLSLAPETDVPVPPPREQPGDEGAARRQFQPSSESPSFSVRLEAPGGRLFAAKDPVGTAELIWRRGAGTVRTAILQQPVLFFIPDTAQDPSRVAPGETLWIEVTLPKKGPPRPIRLGVTRADGRFGVIEAK